MERGRLEAFSDGVLAVAITLLALNLTIAGPGHGTTLAHQLSARWPAFVAYLVSFFTIGIVWVNHHAIVRTVKAVDRTLLFLNLLLLMFVVLIPVATDILADYLTTGGTDAHVAAALYSAVNLGMAVSFILLFAWTLRDPVRTLNPLAPPDRRAALLRYSLGSWVYLVAIGVSFISAPAALALSGLIDLYYMFELVTPDDRRPGRRAKSARAG
jgi:uncharacterized membrane protein